MMEVSDSASSEQYSLSRNPFTSLTRFSPTFPPITILTTPSPSPNPKVCCSYSSKASLDSATVFKKYPYCLRLGYGWSGLSGLECVWMLKCERCTNNLINNYNQKTYARHYYYMLHFTEEIGANEDSRCSHQAIHTANRGRQQRTNQTRRVVRLQKENRENLPVLGHSCSATDSVKYEAIIAQHLQVQPAIRKIRLSQLLGQENGTISKAKNQMPTGRMSAQTLGKDHQTRRKRQFGYSRQKARLCAEEEVMRKFMSNYERVQHFGKLKDVVQDLRAQVIQSSGKLSLLASK